jgi:hypothetical protein
LSIVNDGYKITATLRYLRETWSCAVMLST